MQVSNRKVNTAGGGKLSIGFPFSKHQNLFVSENIIFPNKHGIFASKQS